MNHAGVDHAGKPTLRVGMVCPDCRGTLELATTSPRCLECAAIFAYEGGVLALVPQERRTRASEQVRYFDSAVNHDWEIERPHGAPVLHEWFLREKFRRGIVGAEFLAGGSVLSVCAGSGMDAEFLARMQAYVVAADLSPGAAQRVAERAKRHSVEIMPIVADCERLPFQDESFDVVYVHDGLHHLSDPLAGLSEMARVARHTVCVSEPARATITRVAAKLGLAQEYEEAGNRVARLDADVLEAELLRRGFHTVHKERYAMFYRHDPGWAMRLFSAPGLFQLAKTVVRVGNALVGRWGNKLALVAVRQ